MVTQLCDQHKPIGKAEELEVERIAICWWRFKRAWRYENSEILFGQGEVAIRGQVSNVRDLMMPKDLALTILLESAEKEIEAIGETSLELQEKMFTTDSLFRERWAQLQTVTKQKHDEVVVQRAQEAGISPVVAKEVINKSLRYASKMALVTWAEIGAIQFAPRFPAKRTALRFFMNSIFTVHPHDSAEGKKRKYSPLPIALEERRELIAWAKSLLPVGLELISR